MRRRSITIVVVAASLMAGGLASGQPGGAETRSEERDRAAMARFLGVIEKAPRRGTALDRVYGYHVERGTLDAFLKTYRDRVAADPNDGASWMMIGLVESQRGRDASAVEAFGRAESARPDDALPGYYLGQALVLVGRPDDAVLAFERAIARKPNRADLLEIFQALGRVHQRGRRDDEALAVWSRLEKLFPDDPRVKEQIAASLAEESRPDQALPRYEALAKSARDRFRQVQFQIEAAGLKVRLNRTADALADFEGLLGQLDPESWLHREVRRKIEEIFLRVDDQAGLAGYYEGWIKKNPDDVEAMARLGRALANQGRLAEARGWYRKAVDLAPRRRDLRSALIEQLILEKKYAEAAAQYEAIARADPSNPDAIREWGRVLLRDADRPEAERKQAAAKVWRKLVDARPDDPSTLVMVADLYRSAEMVDEAIALYKTAAQKAPGAPQYAEYLGEFYHRLKRPKDAIATWLRMAEPPNRNARTLGRLAEVLSGFGYKDEALLASTEAAGLDRDDFDLQLRLADLLHAVDRLVDERAQLEFAAKASGSEEQSEAVLDRQIKNFQASGILNAQAEALREELDANRDATADRWRRLARYREADQKVAEALIAADRALAIDPKSAPTLAMIARLYENQGNLSGSADVLRKLATVDRRSRTEYLTGVARLEARLGRKDRALQAGRDLLAAAPGQLDNHQFFAELCFQLGQVDEGLDSLRRAVRLNEADPKALLGLAETLAQQFRTDEAIETFWRAFDKSPDLEAKLSVVSRLTALYLQQNQFDRLVARLERQGREADRQREMTICLAQAYSASGDFGTARAELERLLSANPRDTKLLYQLSVLSETEGDMASAAKFQKQFVDLAPGDEAASRLAQLYLLGGEVADAEGLWARMAADGEPDSGRVLMALDSLLGHNRRESVLAITANLLRKKPDSWEALYREAQALAGLDRPAEAEARFSAILELKVDDDLVGAVAKARKRGMTRPGDPASTSAGANLSTNYYAPTKSFPLQDRLARVSMVRVACGLESRNGASGSAWSPDDFGQARMAAIGWLLAMATRSGAQDPLVASFRAARDRNPSDPRPARDFYYLQLVREEFAETFEAARLLAQSDPADPSAQFALLNSLPTREKSGTSPIVNSTTRPETGPPLSNPEVDQVLAAYRALRARQPGWIHAAILTAVAEELKRAKRGDDLDAFYRSSVDAAVDADSAASVLRLAADRGDVENVLKLFDRHDRLMGSKLGSTPNLYVYYGGYYTLASNPSDSIARAMLARADAGRLDDVASLLDHYLRVDRRPDRAARRARSVAAPNAGGRQAQFQVWAGKNSTMTWLDYPTPNPYYDLAAIQVLRNAYELYRRVDLVSDLRSHFKKALEAGSDVDRAYVHLALCYLDWWEDDKDQALVELTGAAKASKADPELVLGLAELRAGRNEPEEALRVADSFEPVDQKAMQRRELLAIRLAALTGDVARARKAAERLFGLRLDADVQVQLASQMHQLGMHDLAEAVLGRARRRAGGRTSALVSLMLQYERQGKGEVAVQVAHQVLRKIPARAGSGYYDENQEARSEAVQVLARSGQIREMIARVEAQVEQTPGSLQLRQMLADYYKAAGEKDRYKAELGAIAALRPDDARLRLQMGIDLARAGDAPAAVGHYAAAIRKDPSLLGSNFYEIEQAYQQADRVDDLLALVEAADVRTLGPAYYIARLIQSVMRDKARRDRGMAIFDRVWKALPGQRETLFAYIRDDEIWNRPEVYGYLRELVIPADSRKSVAAWWGFVDNISYTASGEMTTLGMRLVDVAARRGKLEELTADLGRAEGRLPNWRGGRALRGLALARRGYLESARGLLAPLADPDQSDAPPSAALRVIAQDLEGVPALRPLAIACHVAALRESNPDDYYLYVDAPARRLVELYRKEGRPDDARRELLLALKRAGNYPYNANVAAYYKLWDKREVADSLLRAGFPADSARIYDEMLADVEAQEMARDYFEKTPEEQRAQYRRGLDRALRGLDAPALAATLKAQVDAPTGPLDLLLVIHPREVERSRLASLVEAAIRSAAASGDLGQARDRLAKRVEAHPGDLPGRVALALASLVGGEAPEESRRAVEGLVEAVGKAPLEPLGPRERANARQRAEAAGQLGLWLVARECDRSPGLRALAKPLTDRALDAARRMADPSWSTAILREAGELAFDRGDRAEAEATWGRMLATNLDPPGRDRVREGSAAAVATLDRFERAARLSKMLAGRGMVDLSLKAIRDPLRGGPPVVPLVVRPSNNGRITVRNPAEDRAKEQAVDLAVEARLAGLEIAWEDAHAPSVEVYEALRDSVLPEGRPSEAFAYPRPMHRGGTGHPRGVGGTLVRWAIRAGRADELRERVEARRRSPTAEGPARSILARLAIARRDFDAANVELKALGKKLAEDKLAATAELACQAALPALAIPETEASALALLDSATAAFVASGLEDSASTLLSAVARRHFEAGRVDEGRKKIRDELEALERASTAGQAVYRYYGGTIARTRTENLRKVAADYARAGRWAEAMDSLGRSVDFQPPPTSVSRFATVPEPLPPLALAAVARHLATLPARERYDAWKRWTMPDEARSTVRGLVASASTASPPDAFGRLGPIGDGSGLIATPELLVLAAKDAGALDELAALARAEVEKKREHAEGLLALVEIARGDPLKAEPGLKLLLAEWSKPLEIAEGPTVGLPPPPKAIPWSDHLRARAALADPTLAPLGRKLAEKLLPRLNDPTLEAHLRRSVAASLAVEEGAGELARTSDPGLKLWAPVGGETAATSRRGRPAARWAASEGHIARVPGFAPAKGVEDKDRPDALACRVPLTGRFEVSVDATGPGAEWGYGGLMLGLSAPPVDAASRQSALERAPRPDSTGQVRPLGSASADALARPMALNPPGRTDRLTIRVEPGSVRYLVNGHLAFEDRDPSPAFPWLVLAGSGSNAVDFRNLTISGTPEIPREVALTHADRLDGWIADFYAEARPDREVGPDGRARGSTLGRAAEPEVDRDWTAEGGMILGHRAPSVDGDGNGPSQSRLAYHRPIGPGESISYEFFRDGDALTVHPALGRLAFLVEPGGVKLRWMTDGPDLDVTGLAPDNAVVEPSSRRGPIPLPLKEGDWNRVKLSIDGRTIGLELNGVKVLERNLEPSDDRVFSFYRAKDRSGSRVRNVILRGDWPSAVTSANLSTPSNPGDSPTRRTRHRLVGDAAIGLDAGRVLREARSLPEDRRVDALAAWVLPGEDRPGFRLAGEFSTPEIGPIPPGSSRVEVGGRLDAPALALVAEARASGRLEELAGRVEKAPAPTDLDRRGKLALLALIRAEQGRDADAASALLALKPLLGTVDPEAPEADRWPELIALSGSVGRPNLRQPATELAEILVEGQLRKDHKGVGEAWRRHAARASALLVHPELGRPDFALEPGLAGWARVSQAGPRIRAEGAPAPIWTVRDGTLTHLPGLDRDLLTFRTPLRGDFEVSGEILGGRPIQLGYGGVAVGMDADGKEITISTLGAPARKAAIDPPIPPDGRPHRVRLAVKAGGMAFTLDGRTLFERGLPAEPDPWLFLFQPAEDSGSIRDLKLEGQPTVPDHLDLATDPDLPGWLVDETSGPFPDPDPAWRMRDGMILGRALEDADGSRHESLLRYHRPMVEDGEISYEFRSEPGKTAVHPALGDVAFLVEPDGVKVHRMGNPAVEPTAPNPGPCPLRPDSWNRMTLAIRGDTLTLRLNDEVVLERPIEPTNSRDFGLFHFIDRGEARVRGVTYRGSWPKKRPVDLGFGGRE